MKNKTEILLSVEGLEKSYGSLKAVRNLSFQVNKGEIFGLLGPNGAGKSTTLECILGTRKSDKGDITLLQKSLAERKRSLFNRIGVQFQNSRYPDQIKVSELCQMTAVLYRRSLDWKQLLNEFSLSDKKDAMVSDLSGGERQKLTLLLALINKPEIVFLDELTTGLDPHARRLVWSHIQNLKSKGLTVVLTSHYMDEVEYLCDRVLIINKGEEIISGTPKDIIERSGMRNLEEAYLSFCGEEVKNEEIVNAV